MPVFHPYPPFFLYIALLHSFLSPLVCPSPILLPFSFPFPFLSSFRIFCGHNGKIWIDNLLWYLQPLSLLLSFPLPFSFPFISCLSFIWPTVVVQICLNHNYWICCVSSQIDWWLYFNLNHKSSIWFNPELYKNNLRLDEKYRMNFYKNVPYTK